MAVNKTGCAHSNAGAADVTTIGDWVHTARAWLAENDVEQTTARVTNLAHVLHHAAENGTP